MQDSIADLPSRYWTFLFDNLKRSIEQIYQTCESDQNPLQCQVTIGLRGYHYVYSLGCHAISPSIL